MLLSSRQYQFKQLRIVLKFIMISASEVAIFPPLIFVRINKQFSNLGQNKLSCGDFQ